MKLKLAHGNWAELKEAEDITVNESEDLMAIALWSREEPSRAALALRMYAAAVIEVWSYGVDVPVLSVNDGVPTLAWIEAFGKMPVMGFNQILNHALSVVNKVAPSFEPTPDTTSPTSPSID